MKEEEPERPERESRGHWQVICESKKNQELQQTKMESVGKASVLGHISSETRIDTQERSPIFAQSMDKAFHTTQFS